MEYILDASKWICGYGGEYALLGELGDETAMLNNDGFMCCLGQFGAQKLQELNEDVGLTLYGTGEPSDVAHRLASVYDATFVKMPDSNEIEDGFDNTKLSNDLMSINDEMDTTPREKVEKIRMKLEKHGHTLKVINEEHLDDWMKRSE